MLAVGSDDRRTVVWQGGGRLGHKPMIMAKAIVTQWISRSDIIFFDPAWCPFWVG
jgi:hypothetical protein